MIDQPSPLGYGWQAINNVLPLHLLSFSIASSHAPSEDSFTLRRRFNWDEGKSEDA